MLVVDASVTNPHWDRHGLDHLGESTQLPRLLPARSPPQLAFGYAQTVAGSDWPEMDQTAGTDDGWQ